MKHLIKKTCMISLVFSALILASSCASLMKSEMIDSHKSLTCSTCHKAAPEEDSPNLKHQENPSRTCLGCHNYLKPQDHHTSDIAPESTATIPAHFKMYNGKMECLTCHQVHTGDDYQAGTPNLLVGGSYGNRRSICFQCHDKAYYSEINPHNSMLKEDKSLNYDTCTLCHSKRPDPRFDRTADVKFKAEIHFLCWRCHPPMDSNFFDIHFLKESTMDSLDIGSPINTFDVMELKKDHATFIMPLDPKGRLTCSTCHNPHQPGVMVDKKAASGAGGYKRLRFSDVCSDCHSD